METNVVGRPNTYVPTDHIRNGFTPDDQFMLLFHFGTLKQVSLRVAVRRYSTNQVGTSC
jgi:hypothetical protein